MRKLYLDDIRIPQTEGWDIVRNYDEFVFWIKLNGVPDEVSFDHDLAEIDYNPSTGAQKFKYYEKTGYDAAKWMCDYCWTNGLPLPEFNCHSANPVGRENILAILNSHKERLND